MNNGDVNKKLEELLAGLNLNTANGGKSCIEKFIKSPQGQKLAGSISNVDKEKLVEKFMNMSNSEIRNKLKNADLSGMSGMSAEDIFKKLR